MTALLTVAVLLATVFVAGWWWATRIDNYSIVDAIWALSFAPVAGIYAWLGEGWLPRRIVIGALLATGVLPDSMIRSGIRHRLAGVLEQHVRETENEQRQSHRHHRHDPTPLQ